MDRPTQLLGVGLGVRGGRESELVMVEWVKGRGVPMSRQTENADFFARFLRKTNPFRGAEEIPELISPPGPDILARYRTYKLHLALRGKIELFVEFSSAQEEFSACLQVADSSHNSDVLV